MEASWEASGPLAQQRNKVAQSKQLASWDTRTPLDVFSPFPVDSGPRLVVRVSSSDIFAPAKTRLHVTHVWLRLDECNGQLASAANGSVALW